MAKFIPYFGTCCRVSKHFHERAKWTAFKTNQSIYSIWVDGLGRWSGWLQPLHYNKLLFTSDVCIFLFINKIKKYLLIILINALENVALNGGS